MPARFASLVESGDLHGLMLAVGAAWVERYHPGQDAALMVTFGPGESALQYPLNPPASDPSPVVVGAPSSSPEET